MINPRGLPDDDFEELRKLVIKEGDRRERVNTASRKLYDALYYATRHAEMTKEQVIEYIKRVN